MKTSQKLYFKNFTVAIFLALLLMITQRLEAGESPIFVGLNADMSSGSAQAGEAIKRGLLIAIKEINDNGGVLGRPLELKVFDHRGNPARGKRNMINFTGKKKEFQSMG